MRNLPHEQSLRLLQWLEIAGALLNKITEALPTLLLEKNNL
jgi:hypothetical protein